MADSVSFSNLDKALSAAKILSQPWYSHFSGVSFDSEAAELMQNCTWPSTKKEAWKYTNILSLAQLDFWLPEQNLPPVLPSEWQTLLNDDFDSSYVFWNGVFCPALSKIKKTQEYSFSRLSGLSSNAGAENQKSLKCEVESSSELERINRLLLSDLFTFEVQKNTKLKKPVAFLFMNSSELNRPQIHSSRLRFTMNEFSEASVLEIHAGLKSNPNQVESHFTEAKLQVSSQFEHIFMNATAAGYSNFFTKKFELSRSSQLKSLHLDLGGDLSRTETFVNLNEPLAEAFVNGVYLAQDKQHIDHEGIISHKSPETISHQCFKGILSDFSKGVFNAKVRIEPGASKSSAAQLNKNLLLSRKAEINSLPRLEIFNDDVKATHGSASGQLDPEQIFYLCSRALSKDQAIQFLVESYAFEMLENMNPVLANKVGPFVSSKLARFQVGDL